MPSLGPLLIEGRATGLTPARTASSAPGVAVEWLGPLLRQLDRRRSDVAGLVGICERGPVDKARRLSSTAEFDAVYGASPAVPLLRSAVRGYFENGGQVCWVVRAAGTVAVAAASEPSSAAKAAGSTVNGLEVSAESPGAWANGVTVSLTPTGGARFDIEVQAPDGRVERWVGLSAADIARINGQSSTQGLASASALITVKTDNSTAATWSFDGSRPFQSVLTGGSDGLEQLRPVDLTAGLQLLSGIEEIGLIGIPDLVVSRPTPEMRPRRRTLCSATSTPSQQAPSSPSLAPPAFTREQVRDAQAELLSYCERMGDRIAILAHPEAAADVDEVLRWRKQFNSAFGALYWPWISVTEGSSPIEVSPVGHVAGIIARSDLAVGPHKPPANERVVGAVALTRPCDDDTHGLANSAGINVIRSSSGRGIRLLGARTLSDDPQWRYINVRRLVSHIEEMLVALADEVVFRPNDRPQRDRVQRSIEHYLDRLWRSGVLDGATAMSAYSVTIDEPEPGGPDETKMIVNVGLQPPWPSEFVVVRISLGAPESILESREGIDGADR